MINDLKNTYYGFNNAKGKMVGGKYLQSGSDILG